MAVNEITFTAPSTSTFDIKPPLWGYIVNVLLPLKYSICQSGSVHIFDAGSAYDRRVLECTFLMNATDYDNFSDFFVDGQHGRGEDVTMSLPTVGGFFPFGADKGDSGNFTVRLLSMKEHPQLLDALRWWKVNCRFLLVSAPAYSLPSVTEYGNLTIGNVSTFRYPQSGFSSSVNFKIDNAETNGPSASEVDSGVFSDNQTVEFDLTATESAVANLANYLVTTPRSAVNKLYDTFQITTRSNDFAFGYEGGSNDTYDVHLMDGGFMIEHVQHDIHNISLSLQRKIR